MRRPPILPGGLPPDIGQRTLDSFSSPPQTNLAALQFLAGLAELQQPTGVAQPKPQAKTRQRRAPAKARPAARPAAGKVQSKAKTVAQPAPAKPGPSAALILSIVAVPALIVLVIVLGQIS